MSESSIISLYVVKSSNGKFFAGFDVNKGQANFVENPIYGKRFSNKYDIKLRPGEMVVELVFDLEKTDIKISEPFRPHRKSARSK